MLSSKSIIDFLISGKCLLIDFLVIGFYIFKTIISFLGSIIKDYSLSTPITLILVGFLITKRISNEQLEINEQNNQEEILQKYLESIEKLLLDYQLNNDNENNQARNVARFKTLTVLRRLTFKPERDKAIILKFLYDTELIIVENYDDNTSKLSLNSCDFEKVDLQYVFFRAINLQQANFQKSNLTGAYFIEANLLCADFCEANLQNVSFEASYLVAAYLIETNLKGANFQQADLTDVHLEGADLEGANLYQTESLDITELKSANNWEKAIYTESEQNSKNDKWIPKDKVANEAKIEEIRNLREGIVPF